MAFHGIFLVVLAGVALASCTSPETGRTRGGGAGADIGNRGKFIQMHEGSRPFENTPNKIPAKPPPLASASQADRLSRQ